MSKAQTIDRLEYTRRRFAKQLGLDEPQHETKKTAKQVAEELYEELIAKPRRAEWCVYDDAPVETHEVQKVEHGLEICPNCGSRALKRDGGCESCLSCGWSACHSS